jgi:PadR family transcriptional regulator, regulatory protein PadR
MRHRTCPRHGADHPCTCAMGHLSRFVEPVLLFLLKKKGQAYGYELASEVRKYALTDADIETSALYRTLRQLEQNGCVTSTWDVEHRGPARRLYVLTPQGEQHLAEWVGVLDHMSSAMAQLVKLARSTIEDSTLDAGERTAMPEHATLDPQPNRIS